MQDQKLTYSKETLKLLKSPKNMGEMKNSDGVGNVGNPVCGDIMRIYIKVGENNKNEKYIKDIKFQTLGCGAAIASTSMLTILAKGKTIDEALKITRQDIVDALGGVPMLKVHCSVLAEEALRKAVEDYQSKEVKT